MVDDIKKTRSEIKRERVAKLREEIDKLNQEAKVLEAREKKAAVKIARYADNRMKNHIGGMVNLTGLTRYQYNDKTLRDNTQDALIENLLVGVFWRAAEALGKASLDELIKLYEFGNSVRHIKPVDRVLPELNPNLEGLHEHLRQLESDETASYDCRDVDCEGEVI